MNDALSSYCLLYACLSVTTVKSLLISCVAREDPGRDASEQDKEINYKMAEYYDSLLKKFKDVFWYQFKTGDIVKVII